MRVANVLTQGEIQARALMLQKQLAGLQRDCAEHGHQMVNHQCVYCGAA